MTSHIFEKKGQTVANLKALSSGKYELSGLCFGSTLNICQDFLKSDNLLHKQSFVDYQIKDTVLGSIKNFYQQIAKQS